LGQRKRNYLHGKSLKTCHLIHEDLRMRAIKSILVISLLKSCVAIAICCSLAHAGQQGNKPQKITKLFIHAWLPELGRLEVDRGSVDFKLLEVADLTRNGNFKLAEQRLDSLEQAGDDPRLKFLATLFRLQVMQRRYELVSGGRIINGESRIDYLSKEAAVQELATKMDNLGRQMLPADGADAWLAIRYSATLDMCLRAMPPIRRYFKTNEGFSNNQSINNGAFADNIEPHLQSLGSLNLEALGIDALGKIQRDLLLDLVKGSFAAANHDLVNARRYFEEGINEAMQGGEMLSAAEFMLRRGDLDAAPYGDAMTFGYDLASEQAIRGMIGFGVRPKFILTPADTQLESAESWYKRAGEIFDRLSESGASYRLKIRRANLARMKGNYSSAIALYRDAAAADSLRYAALAKASYANLIITQDNFMQAESKSPLQEAITSLVESGDMGGALSVAEMAHSWAARLWFINRDFNRSAGLLRITVAALEKNNLNRAAVGMLSLLSNIYAEIGRAETALQYIQEAIDIQSQHLVAAQKANEKYINRLPALGSDPAELLSEKKLQSLNLSIMSRILNGKFLEERSPYWREQLDLTDKKIAALSMEIRSDNPLEQRLQQQSEQLLQRSKGLLQAEREIMAALRGRRTCEGLLQGYRDARNKINELGNPIKSIQLDALAGECDPGILNQPRAELQRINPVQKIREALASRSAIPSFQIQMDLSNALNSMLVYFDLAASLQAYDLLARWIDGIDSLIKDDPTLDFLNPVAQGYRALTLIALNKPEKAREILSHLVFASKTSSLISPIFKLSMLNLLIEAEALLGNAEGALLAFERLKFEQELLYAQKTGVRPETRQSAELAMLEREAVTRKEKLSGDELMHLQRLREEVANSSAPAQKPPTLDDIRAALSSLPPDVTVMIYHIARQYILLWRATANKPIELIRLDAPVASTKRLVFELEEKLESGPGNNDWQALSRQLYKLLIEPAGPIEKGSTLAFIAQGPLATIPFEALGLNSNEILLANHPVVYANRLGKGDRVSPIATNTKQDALVVGLSQDLPNAEKEAAEVAKVLGAKLLIGRAANIQKVSELIRSARWVHFATHAEVNTTNPYLSSLYLSGDDKIEAWKLFRDAPQAEVITLSACDTKREAQDLTSLSAITGDTTSLTAFASAGGARWILASLWQADDQLAEKIMVEFYRAQIKEGLSPWRALQKAKLNLMKNSHPFQYAQFLLSARDLSSLKTN
jgi:CHAT domain-containing protein